MSTRFDQVWEVTFWRCRDTDLFFELVGRDGGRYLKTNSNLVFLTAKCWI